MKQRLLSAVLSAGLLFSTAAPSIAATHYYVRRTPSRAARARYIRHKRHMKTIKRVGIGTVGGAAIGALAAGGKGAGIGALAGAGAGALYDSHQKHHGHY